MYSSGPKTDPRIGRPAAPIFEREGKVADVAIIHSKFGGDRFMGFAPVPGVVKFLKFSHTEFDFVLTIRSSVHTVNT